MLRDGASLVIMAVFDFLLIITVVDAAVFYIYLREWIMKDETDVSAIALSYAAQCGGGARLIVCTDAAWFFSRFIFIRTMQRTLIHTNSICFICVEGSNVITALFALFIDIADGINAKKRVHSAQTDDTLHFTLKWFSMGSKKERISPN